MSVEALSLLLCLVSGIYGRPSWDGHRCDERAVQILQIAERHSLDPLLIVAVNIHECDLREDVGVKFFSKDDEKRAMGEDACPMGYRIWWPSGKKPKKVFTPTELYELAAAKMERLKRWCRKQHRHHHFIKHWNQGNPVYSRQIFAILSALRGRKPSPRDLTDRTKLIVRRILLGVRNISS